MRTRDRKSCTMPEGEIRGIYGAYEYKRRGRHHGGEFSQSVKLLHHGCRHLITGTRMHACTHASTPSIHPSARGVQGRREKKNVPTYGKAGVEWSGVEWSQGDCGVRRALEYAPHPRRSAQFSSSQLSREIHRVWLHAGNDGPSDGRVLYLHVRGELYLFYYPFLA